jgi:hypothetical protein
MRQSLKDEISARRVLKTKQFLDNRLEFHIFSGSLAMTL